MSDLQGVSDFLASFGPSKYGSFEESYVGSRDSNSADYSSLYYVAFEPFRYSPNYASRVAYLSGLRGLGAYWDPLTAKVLGVKLTFYYSPPGFGPWTLIDELGAPSQLMLTTEDPGIAHLSLLYRPRGAKFDFVAIPLRTDRLCNWEFELQRAIIVPAADDPIAFDYALQWYSWRWPGSDPSDFMSITPELTDFFAHPRQCVPFDTS